MSIYQEIWDADQAGSGVRAIGDVAQGDPGSGYVLVDEKGRGKTHKLLPQAEIPAAKRETYELTKALFNNYELSQFKSETTTSEEEAEIDALMAGIIDTEPMRLARSFIEAQTADSFSTMGWYAKVKTIWFKEFSSSSGIDLSGFEHVVVGEAKGQTLGGYHWWYKYFLDDMFELRPFEDRVDYLGPRYGNAPTGATVPDVVTIAYDIRATDFFTGETRTLKKKIGGFWVGPSIEGLMALGTVRFIKGARAPREATINGHRYALELFKDASGAFLRTFYPKYLGPVDGPLNPDIMEPDPDEDVLISPMLPQTSRAVRILAARVNPSGQDEGRETVTLLNATPLMIELADWQLVDKNGGAFILGGIQLGAGAVHQAVLPPLTCQLSNQGGSITLNDHKGRRIDHVTYTREDAAAQGATVVFS